MTDIIGANEITLWLQPDGPGTTFDVYGVEQKAAGMTGKSDPGPGRTPVYGRDRFANPTVIKTNVEAPGDLPGGTLQFFETTQLSVMRDLKNRGCTFNVQIRTRDCGTIDHPTLWDKLRHWGDGLITNIAPGDAPSLEFDGAAVSEEATVAFSHIIELVQLRLTAQTASPVVNANLLSIAGIPDETCNNCGTGYAGADQLLWIGSAAHSYLITANVLFTRNGGGAWTNTSADPFAVGEDVTFIEANFFDNDSVRLIVGTETVNAASKAQIAYADVDLGDEGTTVWTSVTITGTVVGDVITGMLWPVFNRLYLASAGDIYLSEDQGESVPNAAIYAGATLIEGFSISPDKNDVWAFGASNLILRERNQSGTFDTMVGPSGGATFTALTLTGRGSFIYAGNGTSIYRNTDGAGNANNWTLLKNFGANKVVRNIQSIGGARAGGGDSELLRVVVDDTTGLVAGEVWITVDGGATFQQLTELTNLGYNDAYFSEVDDNLGIVVGDISGGAGVIHKISPVI